MKGQKICDPVSKTCLNLLNASLIFIVSVLIMLRQISTPAYFSVVINDTYSYSSWAWQFKEALSEGLIYPRWMPLDFSGYGSPTFVFYPPLSFYIVALFHALVGSITLAMNLTRVASVFISALGIYYLVKAIFSEKTAIVTALFYVLFPYNVLQYYAMGSFASTISLMWFCPILLGMVNFCNTRQFKYLAYSGLFYGALILTHVINAYMFTFVMLGWAFYQYLIDKKSHHILSLVLTLFSGILVAAIYVLPLVFEKAYIHLNSFFTKNSGLYYADSFIIPKMVNKIPPGFIWSAYYDLFFFHVILICIIVLVFYGLIIIQPRLSAKKNTSYYHHLFFCIIVASLFLLLGYSSFLWENIPFFKYVHQPFRWLNITSLATSLLFASLVDIYSGISKIKELCLIVCAIFLAFAIINNQTITKSSTFSESELIPIRPENTSRDHLPVTALRKIVEKDSSVYNKVVFVKGDGKAEVTAWKSSERIVGITSTKPVIARIRTFNFPGWTAYVDDKQSEINTEPATGAMLIGIPEGNHRLKLVFNDTPSRLYGKVISIVTITLLFLFVTYRSLDRS